MLLYAVLEHADSGIWPARATLIPLEGDPLSIKIDPSEAQAAADASVGELDAYNASIGEGVSVAGLGAASPDAWRFCPYAVRCPAFWDAIDQDWADEGIRAAAGPVLVRETAQRGSVSIKLEAACGSAAGEAWLYALDPERFPASCDANPSDWIAATSLVGAPGSGRYRPSEQTRLVLGASAPGSDTA
jgi:hypothetical protein